MLLICKTHLAPGCGNQFCITNDDKYICHAVINIVWLSNTIVFVALFVMNTSKKLCGTGVAAILHSVIKYVTNCQSPIVLGKAGFLSRKQVCLFLGGGGRWPWQ